jgi:hypothetical protein
MPNSYKSVAYTTTGSGSNEDVYTCGVVASVIKSLSIYNPNASNAYTITVKLYKSSNTTSYEVNYQSVAAKTAWNVMPSDGAINLQNGDKIQVVTSQAGLVVSLSYLESSVSVSGINLAAIADVSDVAATDGQFLVWDSTTGLATWETIAAGGVTSVEGTSPISVSGTTTKTVSISAATTSAAGSMSSEDKTKLDGIATGAEVNVKADWNATTGDAEILNKPTVVTQVTGTTPIVSSGGTTPDISIPASSAVDNGYMSSSQWTKLDGIETGAQVNDVTSVNTQVGAVVLDTDDVLEGITNKYFTTARVDTQIDALVSNGELVKSVNGEFPDGSGDVGFTTDAIPEGSTNLYFTSGRVDTQIDARITAGDIVTSVNAAAPSSTGAVTIDTDDVSEGATNKYYTDTKVDDRIEAWSGAAAVFGDTVDAQGAFKSPSGVWAQNQAPLRMYESTANGTNFVALKAPATLSADVTWTMPAADGTSGQVFSTNGSGTTSWVTKKVTQVTSKTVATGAWTLVSGVYEASISDSAILSTSIVDVVPDNASASTIRTAQMLPRTDSSTGSVKIYSTNAPAASITVTLNIFDL